MAKKAKPQFGESHVYYNPSMIETDVNVSFSKVFGSWAKLKEFLPSGISVDSDKLRNIFPTVFQPTEQEVSNSDSHCNPHRAENDHNFMCIDLKKLEKSVTLNNSEKKRLRYILNAIKCDAVETNTPKKCVKRKKKRNTVVKHVTRTYAKDVKNTMIKKPQSKIKVRSSVRDRNSVCNECTHCSEKETEIKRRRKLRLPATTLTVSEERLLRAIVKLDPGPHGDTVEYSAPIGDTDTINAILKEKSINIGNIALQYVNPTYVVQYSGTNSEPESYRRDRLYSTKALEAHLGQRPWPVRGENVEDKTYTHYDPSYEYVVGAGTPEVVRKPSQERPRAVEIKGRTRGWEQDHIPFIILPSKTGETKPTANDRSKKEKGSRCKTFKQCLRKFLCLSSGEDSKSTVPDVEAPLTRMDKGEYLKIKRGRNSPDQESPVTRMTKEEFFKGKPKKG